MSADFLLNRVQGTHTGNVELAALVEESQALAATVTEETLEDAVENALVLLEAVAGLDLLVAAGDLGLTTGVLGLLEGQLLGVLGASSSVGEGHSGGGEGSGNSEELHCD